MKKEIKDKLFDAIKDLPLNRSQKEELVKVFDSVGSNKTDVDNDTNEELINLCDVDLYDIIDFSSVKFTDYLKYCENIELDINKIYTINWTAVGGGNPAEEQMVDSIMPILKIKFENYNNNAYKYSYSTCIFTGGFTDVMEINIIYVQSIKVLVLSISFKGVLDRLNNNSFLLENDIISNATIGDIIEAQFEGRINVNKPIIIRDTKDNKLVINNYAYFNHPSSLVGHDDLTITSIIFTDNFMINIKIEEEHDDSPEGFITFTAEFLENSLISQ